MARHKFTLNCDGVEMTLRDSVEMFALGICEDIKDGEKRTGEILRKCRILDSLSNTLIIVNKCV